MMKVESDLPKIERQKDNQVELGQPSVPVNLLTNIIAGLKDRIAMLKQNRCLKIWNKIKQDREDDKLWINDGLWRVVKEEFEEALSCSLVKFLSSFICQTGNFELSKSFFLFNLAAAYDQKKFFLQESLFEVEVREIEDLVCKLDGVVSGKHKKISSFIPIDQHSHPQKDQSVVELPTPVDNESLSKPMTATNQEVRQKKTNLSTWLHSDCSILESQPPTRKIQDHPVPLKGEEPFKLAALNFVKERRRSLSERGELRQMQSPLTDGPKSGLEGHSSRRKQQSIALPSHTQSKELFDAKRKTFKKKTDKKDLLGDLHGGSSTQGGKRRPSESGKTKKRPVATSNSRDHYRNHSSKFTTERTEDKRGDKYHFAHQAPNIFGEKMSLFLAGGGATSRTHTQSYQVASSKRLGLPSNLLALKKEPRENPSRDRKGRK